MGFLDKFKKNSQKASFNATRASFRLGVSMILEKLGN